MGLFPFGHFALSSIYDINQLSIVSDSSFLHQKLNMLDYIVIGQGVVGTVLSHYLIDAGYSIKIVDHSRANTATKVAAGLFNPITYRRFVKSWKADDFYPEAQSFYQNNEQLIGDKILFDLPFLKIFNDIREQNDWLAATADKRIENYVEPTLFDGDFEGRIKMPFGGGVVHKAGFVKLKVFLEQNRQHFIQQDLLVETESYAVARVEDQEVAIDTDGETLMAKNVIFCEGVNAVNNRYFSWLPFQPVKGEVLKVKSPSLKIDCAINKGFFILPIGGDVYKVGSTYDWRNPDEITTDKAKEELINKLKEVTDEPFEVVEHIAGVRPAIKDRHPVVGNHPEIDNVFVFNGTGSKGVMMVPWVAKHFVEHLKFGNELDREIGIKRFHKYYLNNDEKN